MKHHPAPSRLLAVHPVLMCSDVQASARFYAWLGFSLQFMDSAEQPRYAVVTRDDAELHLQWHQPAQFEVAGDRPAYRFLVDSTEALYAELAARDATLLSTSAQTAWHRPADTPWGTREFHLRDPDGNCLQLYQGLQAAEP